MTLSKPGRIVFKPNLQLDELVARVGHPGAIDQSRVGMAGVTVRPGERPGVRGVEQIDHPVVVPPGGLQQEQAGAQYGGPGESPIGLAVRCSHFAEIGGGLGWRSGNPAQR
jgi:hypothetical protein